MLRNQVGVLSTRNQPQFLGMGSRLWRKMGWFYLFLAPWIMGFLFFVLVPMVIGFLMSFTNFNGGNFNSIRFVGLDNYAEAFGEFFSNGDAWLALQRTLSFTITSVLVNTIIALSIASLLSGNMRGRTIFRTLFYLPAMLPLVASIWVFRSLLDNNVGALNAILDLIFPGTHVPWLTQQASLSLIIFTAWGGLGGAMIIYIAGIQGIPTELRDAATVDGASSFQVFLNITVPLLSPLIMYQTVLGVIGGVQVLVTPILLTPGAGGGGGMSISTIPVRANYMFMVHIYQESFNRLRFGYGSALLWILFALILILTLFLVRTSRQWVYYEVDPDRKPGE